MEERLGQLESSGLDNVTLENLDQCEKMILMLLECLNEDVSLDLEHYTIRFYQLVMFRACTRSF
ncbi:hypothetical protein Bca4012_087418 [Brassica carinata]